MRKVPATKTNPFNSLATANLPARSMKLIYHHLLSTAMGLLMVIFSSCNSPKVIHDLSDASFPMVDQDSTAVQFPQDFNGSSLVVGFIYTHCPDVCPIITANMINISKKLPNGSDTRFVVITFDPERDTPGVLKKYAQSFKLEDHNFTLLTGKPAVVDSLLTNLDFKAEVAGSGKSSSEKGSYLMKHTNRILVMDEQGRVRMEYPGSVVPPELVVEDLQLL